MIDLTENLRVVDYDALNYAIEKRHVVEKGDRVGEVDWKTIAFAGSLHMLQKVARREFMIERMNAARAVAAGEYTSLGVDEKLAALPTKKKQS